MFTFLAKFQKEITTLFLKKIPLNVLLKPGFHFYFGKYCFVFEKKKKKFKTISRFLFPIRVVLIFTDRCLVPLKSEYAPKNEFSVFPRKILLFSGKKKNCSMKNHSELYSKKKVYFFLHKTLLCLQKWLCNLIGFQTVFEGNTDSFEK